MLVNIQIFILNRSTMIYIYRYNNLDDFFSDRYFFDIFKNTLALVTVLEEYIYICEISFAINIKYERVFTCDPQKFGPVPVNNMQAPSPSRFSKVAWIDPKNVNQCVRIGVSLHIQI